MKIWAYAICWNEEKILPYYLRHYSKICDKIIIYDNESTDRSREIIEAHPKAELRTYKTEGTIRDDVYLQIKENAVYDAKGKADYVIVGDIDEFLYHPDINLFLEQNSPFSFYRPAGIQMVSDSYPTTDGMIYDECKIGVPDYRLCKPLLLNPNKIDKLKLSPGGHVVLYLEHEGKAYRRFSRMENGKMVHGVEYDFGNGWSGDGQGWTPEWNAFKPRFEHYYDSPLKMLHYKYIGVDYVVNRQRELASRLSDINQKEGWGRHYYNDTVKVFEDLKKDAIKINL